jgi:hypothetical protein
MAENVVSDDAEGKTRDEKYAANTLNTPYSEMAAPEKVSYEVRFARNALDAVIRCAPSGIKFRSLEIDNFQTIYASGTGLTRRLVNEMFMCYKNQRGELMPKPQSHIKEDGHDLYKFAVTFKPRFGMEVSDPFQAAETVGFKESVPDHLKTFARLAGENKVNLAAQPNQIAAEKSGQYRRFVYKVTTGTTTYADFHKFVRALYDARVPCAFKKISITPVRDEEVKVVAEILFSVKE